MNHIKHVIIPVFILVLFTSMIINSSAAAVPVDEQSLNPLGSAYEIHAGSDGYLWVSDYWVGEIWKMDPAGSAPVIYDVGGYPADAQPDNLGGVWWVDTPDVGSPTINKLNIITGASLTWDLNGSSLPYGLAIDSLNRIWVAESDYSLTYVYRFNPTNRELCTYPLPDSGSGFYPVAQGTYIWLADAYNGRILRINTLTNRMDWWQLPDGSSPYGVAVQSADRIWITDTGNLEIGLLVPSTGIYTSYALPVGTQISLLSIENGKVWYTEQYQTTFGVLDPALAIGTESETTTGWVDVDPTPCDTVSNPKNGDAGPTTGIADSAAIPMEIIHEGDGWTILQLPDSSFPWGIVAVNGLVNVVDNGRQKLVQINESALQNPGLTLVKSAVQETYNAEGDVINYSYDLTNSGNVILTGPFTVTDDRATVICPATSSLALGASISCSATYTVTQADLDAGSVTNTASGHAMFGGSSVLSATDSATVNAVQNPVLAMVKEASPTSYDSVGDIISYSFHLTNSGNVTLVAPFTVTDNKTTDEACPQPVSLAPGASITCTASYTITQADLDAGSVTNIASGHAFFGADAVNSTEVQATVTRSLVEYKVFLPLIKR